jgi:hypothetical protein
MKVTMSTLKAALQSAAGTPADTRPLALVRPLYSLTDKRQCALRPWLISRLCCRKAEVSQTRPQTWTAWRFNLVSRLSNKECSAGYEPLPDSSWSRTGSNSACAWLRQRRAESAALRVGLGLKRWLMIADRPRSHPALLLLEWEMTVFVTTSTCFTHSMFTTGISKWRCVCARI